MHITSLSLIIFTVLLQTSAGLILVSQAAGPKYRDHLTLCLPAALILGAGGLLFASTHLASLLSAVFVLNNMANSALSLEILFCSLFIGAMLVTLWAQFKKLDITLTLGWICAVTGLLAIWSVANVYMQQTIPTFNTYGTLLYFTGTGLVAGPAVGTLVYTYSAGKKKSDGPDTPGTTFMTVLLAGIGLLLMALPLNMMARSVQDVYGQTGFDLMLTHAAAPVLLIAGPAATMIGVIFILLTWLNMVRAKAGMAQALAGTLLILAGAFASRFLFYESYMRLGS